MSAEFAAPGVEIFAPARLHLGFLDLGGGLGRRFGSLGVAITGFGTRLRLRPAASLQVVGPARLETLARRLLAELALPPAQITLVEEIPAHAGLGSGTQLALAAGMGLARLHGRPLTPQQVAIAAGRGARSGIGIAAFEQGGFLVDGGRGKESGVPPLLSRLPVPESWRWLLLFDPGFRGLHGERERQAFRRLPRYPRHLAAEACHRLLMQGLPALAEADFAAFAETLGWIQRANGDYFAPAQGGRYTSPRVAAALKWLEDRGWRGLGQSSWGPTGFCLFPDPESAASEVRRLAAALTGGGLHLEIVAGRNHGAQWRS
ncbi:beta-ribofuranosylaminobenzene 5'-phosphate synthase [Methylomarinovum caldicuralii]|uniref:Beta-ribofuranosylaminobenzene 5'-phosphate synthase n=1 Tax=Methylomarinovum caldicuralii TaxID=438856 RepID=A0AAU9C0L7_9GAMM|nr:beta-ribofuranosylaminobenzene 5'-phosphate synthase family protein [Methylomarinovum caldicuralii]BCX81857.1 beta-ribofuranosylaminobenzene 5'-phosphate synthase [Methylomarinovum caldicuralii]